MGPQSKFSNLTTPANSWDIQAHLKSSIPFKNKFLLTKNPLTLEQQIEWKHLIESKGSGVWVYDFISLNFGTRIF